MASRVRCPSEPAQGILLRAPAGGLGLLHPSCCPPGRPWPASGPPLAAPELAQLLQTGLRPCQAAPEPRRLCPPQAPTWAPCCFRSASTSYSSLVAGVLPDSGCWRGELALTCELQSKASLLLGPEGAGLLSPIPRAPGRDSLPAQQMRAPHLQGVLPRPPHLRAAPALALPPGGPRGPLLRPHSIRGALCEAAARAHSRFHRFQNMRRRTAGVPFAELLMWVITVFRGSLAFSALPPPGWKPERWRQRPRQDPAGNLHPVSGASQPGLELGSGTGQEATPLLSRARRTHAGDAEAGLRRSGVLRGSPLAPLSRRLQPTRTPWISGLFCSVRPLQSERNKAPCGAVVWTGALPLPGAVRDPGMAVFQRTLPVPGAPAPGGPVAPLPA